MSINDRVRHESDKVIFEDHVELGYNYRMTDIQAAVGIKQLEKLDNLLSAAMEKPCVYCLFSGNKNSCFAPTVHLYPTSLPLYSVNLSTELSDNR